MKIIYRMFLVIIILVATNFAQNSEHGCAVTKTKSFNKLIENNKLYYPGDASIDVTYYKLDLDISYSPEYLTGKVTVEGKTLEDNTTSFFLDLQTVFTIDSIKMGINSLSFTHSNDKIYLALPTTFNSEDFFSMDIYYRGVPGSSGFGSFEFYTQYGNPVIWTLSEPYGASDWFPCKDTPSDKVDSSDVIVTADEIFYTVSNGSLESIEDLGNGKKRFHWKNHHPIAHYLISLAMTNYSIYEQEFISSDNDTIPVLHYNYPSNLNDYRIAQLEKTTEMLALYNNIYGPYPYPDEKYGHAEFGWGGGMEHQTVSSMGSFGQTIIAHELAHQWFGDKVTCADWQSIWLNEGFATFSEAVWLGHVNGESAYQDRIEGYMASAKNASGSIYVQNISSVNSIFNYNRSYAKAAVVLHMLKGIVGDETFFEILQTYLSDERFAYNVAVTEDFQEIAESVSGRDLSYFFSEWIFGESYPIYSVDFRTTSNSSNNYEYVVKINQQRRTNPQYFTMPIEIEFNFYDGSDSTIVVFNNSILQEFTFNFEKAVHNYQFDPKNKILKSVTSITNTEEEALPTKFSLAQNYPNPFSAKGETSNPTTTIKFSIPTNASNDYCQLTIYNSLGQQVAELINKPMSAGNYSVEFSSSNVNSSVNNGLASGVYYYRLQYGNLIQTRKMIILK